MKVTQVALHSGFDQPQAYETLLATPPDLLLVFGSVLALRTAAPVLAEIFPAAHRLGCSTAGEISSEGVNDNTLVVTAIRFSATRLAPASTELQGMDDSLAAGQRLGQQLSRDGLRAVLIFGQGVEINGSALLSGLAQTLGPGIPITGGLAGDGGAFEKTWVLDSQGVSDRRVSCIGLYGAQLCFTHGSFGGWTPFGPARKVTRCRHNILYELDGEPALQIYKRYLGDHARDLPASGLLFPLAMLASDHSELGLTRTILGVNDADGSMTLAGDIDPQGFVRLMHASTDALVDGAEVAALAARQAIQAATGGGLALLVSCVGRKLVMGGRVDEEVEAVAEVFGQQVAVTGFYSYGEIGPYSLDTACKLHNQTMTVTFLGEQS